MKVKICGLTRACDIDYINEAEPDYIGFVFAKSKRQITEENALNLRNRMRENIIPIGVFVNEEIERIERIIKSQTIDIVQLHGDETPQYVEEIKRKTKVPVIKAIRIGKEEYTDEFFHSYKNSGVDYFLLDSSGDSATYGGTGKTFNWNQIPQIPLPYFLAGGLNQENIARAITETKAFAMDISSGVETDGVKDKDKILEMIRRIRNV